MNAFSSVLLLLSSVVISSTERCAHLPKDLREQIPAFEREHELMNLKLSCDAVKTADYNVQQLLKGRPIQLDNSWCVYYRTAFDFLAIAGLFFEPYLLEMPWRKINATSVLHPNTDYGCAYRTYDGFFGLCYITLCMYKRKNGETRCFCN
ncbi:hypothetical protein Q1695_015909 [Nippostrongylus brasiliensis]|nr:hypothetical protein Q1695_015909 [Nippostrongylus brasiliensis]